MVNTDMVLWGFERESIRSRNYYHNIGAYAIAWYVTTGRATYEWVAALAKANPKRVLARIEKAEAGCENAAIKIVTTYLNRYCGYPYTENHA